jgi:hypothetical protein
LLLVHLVFSSVNLFFFPVPVPVPCCICGL